MSDGGPIDSKLLDLSHYDAETFNPSCFYANGVRRVIIACYQPHVARNMIQNCRREGIEVIGLYGLVYFGLNDFYVHRDTNNAIALAEEFGIERIWIDAEIDAKDIGVNVPASNPQQRVEQLRAVRRKIEKAGFKPGIYTGGWWWPAATGNSTEFSDLPLWHSAYFSDRREVRTVDYGGWKNVAIHQYSSSIQLCGRVRDHNYLYMEEDEMTAAERELLLKIASVVGGYPDGREYKSVDEALGFFREFERLDHRHGLGIAKLWEETTALRREIGKIEIGIDPEHTHAIEWPFDHIQTMPPMRPLEGEQE